MNEADLRELSERIAGSVAFIFPCVMAWQSQKYGEEIGEVLGIQCKPMVPRPQYMNIVGMLL